MRQAALDSREGQATALSGIGGQFTELGDHDQALGYYQKALDLFCELGDIGAQARAWDRLGHCYLRLGRHPEAVVCYQHAVLLFSLTGDRFAEATSHGRLGDAQDAAGAAAAARRAWQRALGILRRLNHPGADAVRAKLRSRGG